jgi:hypothetical protein
MRLVSYGRDLDRESEGGLRNLLVALGVAAAAAVVIAANVLLLGNAAANNAPVGGLSPRTHLPAAPHWTVRPTRGRPHDEHADD